MMGVIVLLSFLSHLGCDQCFEAEIVSKIILVGISIGFIVKYGFGRILRDGMRVLTIWTLVAVALVVIAFLEMERIILLENVTTTQNIKFFVYNLGTGFFEEVFFRVFVFYYILKLMKNRQNPIWKSTLWTSLCFGLVHIMSLFSGFAIVSTITQVVLATLLGIIYQGFYLRTKSIILVAVFHGLFNYFGMYRSRLLRETVSTTDGFEWSSLISSLVILGILSLVFVLPIRRYLISSARVPEVHLE